jgi:TM2 domain-containing membrane protein YozV
MSQAINAALLSGLLIPGAGQWYLGRKLRGATLMLLVLIAIVIMVIEASQQATAVLAQLQQQGGIVSTERIIEIASQSSQQANTTLINIATLLFIGSWFFGIIDAYRTGKRQSVQQPL